MKSLSWMVIAPCCLLALGGRPEVVSGDAQYEASGPSEVVRVSDKTILHYKKFHLAENESTRFEQPSSKSTLLCRVKGKEASVLRGRLEANGKLLFINPNGIIFSETAQVHAGTLIASTLDVQNDDFINDRFRFALSKGSTHSSIVNQGTVQGAHNIVFVAPKIKNTGIISAKAGKIALLGGERVTLDFDGDRMISFAVENSVHESIIEQSGQMVASEIYMKLPTAERVIRNVLNTQGVVEAGHIEIKDGVIRLTSKSVTEANKLFAEGRAVVVEGELKIASSCELNGQEKVIWKRENTVPHLQTKTDTLYLMGPVSCQQWSSQISGQVVLENSIHVQNSSLIFDAPVIVNAPEVTLSTGEIGGSIRFSAGIDAAMEEARLKLAAGAGNIDFEKEIGEAFPLSQLTITSAHNVNTKAVKVGTLVQQEGTGITRFDGAVVASHGIDLHVHAINIGDSVHVETGPLSIENTGPLKLNESATVLAQSIHQKGPGEVFLQGKLVATRADISFESPVDLLSSVVLQAKKGGVTFHQRIRGLGGLEVRARHFESKGNIGRLAHLKVDTDEWIRVQNIGQGREGIEGLLQLHSKGHIYFGGSEYIAAEHHYSADQSFEFSSGKETSFIANNISSIAFEGGPIHLPDDSSLIVSTTLGSIDLPAVQGKARSHLRVESAQGRITLGGPIDVGSLKLIATQPIPISHPITAQTEDFFVQAHLHITSPEILLQALHGKIMQFDGPITGDTALSLHAPEGKVVLNGRLNGRHEKLKKITINAHEIVQNEAVSSTGPVNYKADHISLGGDITTNKADIILDGSVMLTNNDAIHLSTTFYKGNVHLGPGLNADQPSRALIITCENGIVRLKGDIGTIGPLGQLMIEKSGKAIFHGNIGGPQAGIPGIMGRLKVKSVASECQGDLYHVGELLWDTPNLSLTNPGTVEFKTSGLPMRFLGQGLTLKKTTGFTINTQGGRLDLTSLTPEGPQPIFIQTGQGEAHLAEIGKKVTELHVEGRSVLLGGHLEADRIWIEAENHLEYDRLGTEKIIPTSIKSSGPITLNSKQGMVGTLEDPLKIETLQDCFVGAKTVAYLEGICADQMPHVYPKNPPPRLFFNGYEYNYLFIDDAAVSEELLNSLSPALIQNTPTSLMDGSTIKPRRAPIYYEVPK